MVSGGAKKQEEPTEDILTIGHWRELQALLQTL